MIILDSETTSLAAPEAAPIEQQPCILEFAAIKLDDRSLKECGRLEFLCDPRVPIPKEAIEITGITPDKIKGKPPFIANINTLTNFFLGERRMAAHNMAFDSSVLRHELMRIGRAFVFPWPPEQICTVERSLHIKGYRLTLGALHEIATGKPHQDAHRAMADVEALVRVVIWMAKKGIL